MYSSQIKRYLDDQGVDYLVIAHPPVYTAQETALSAYYPGWEVAKTVVVRIDGETAMVAVPACCKVDFDILREITGAQNIELTAEDELEILFPDCEIGAMPPLGNLYGMKVYVSRTLADQETIIFNAGNHSELIEMRYKDFERIVHPRVINFTLEIF